MCGGGAPATVRTDPVADAERAAAQAAVTANEQAAGRRKSRRASQLLATQPATLGSTGQQQSVLYGKPTLGG